MRQEELEELALASWEHWEREVQARPLLWQHLRAGCSAPCMPLPAALAAHLGGAVGRHTEL